MHTSRYRIRIESVRSWHHLLPPPPSLLTQLRRICTLARRSLGEGGLWGGRNRKAISGGGKWKSPPPGSPIVASRNQIAWLADLPTRGRWIRVVSKLGVARQCYALAISRPPPAAIIPLVFDGVGLSA